MIPIGDAERGAEDALTASRDTSNTEHVFEMMDYIATNLRLKIQPCEQTMAVTALKAATKGPVLLAYKVDKKDCSDAPHIHFIIVCTRSGAIIPFVKYPAMVTISNSALSAIESGDDHTFAERMFGNFSPREWSTTTFLGAWKKQL